MGDEKRLQAEAERWHREVWAPSVSERPERRAAFVNDAGAVVEPLYTPLEPEAEGFDYLRDLGFPGEFPYTRGVDPSGYRRELPIVSAYSGFGTAEDSNLRYKQLIGLGVEGITAALDLPTQIGYDSDHIMARGEVGRVGVPVCTLRDLEVLFDGIPIESLKHVSASACATGPIMLAMYVALGGKRGLDPSRYKVQLNNDVLKEYVARGTQIFRPRPSVRFAMDALEWCAREAPHWRPLTVTANHFDVSGAGSTASTAFAMANAKCYLDELLARGLQIDQVAPLFRLFPNDREDFFLAVANYRVTRRIWAHLIRDHYGAKNPASWQAHLQLYAHGPRETVQEPLNNIVRITMGALTCLFGGVEDFRTASFDEAINVPSDEAVRVAIRTQQILAHEYGITTTADPLGGSYYLEALTNRMEREIRAIMARVDELGGAYAAMETGYIQRVMGEGALRRQQAFERKERVSIGLNVYPVKAQYPEGTFRIDPEAELRQLQRLREVRRERDDARVRAMLREVENAARAGDNTVPAILDAVRAYASVGEICDVLRPIFGEYVPDRSF